MSKHPRLSSRIIGSRSSRAPGSGPVGAPELSFALSLVVLIAGSGCTKFASELDTDGAGATGTQEQLLPDPTVDYSCVSEEAGNPITASSGPPLAYSLTARDFLSGQTPANLKVRACFRGDVNCNRPATENFGPDAYGVVTLPLTDGFNGYVEIVADDMVSTLVVFPAPLTPELAEQLAATPVALLPLDALLAFGQAAQLELNPGAGVVSINTWDCAGPAAANVRLELNASAVPFTFVDGLPIAFQDTTTDDGSGGFANVLPGLVVVRGFRADTGEVVGLETMLVRAQWVTVGTLMPRFAAL